MVMTAGRSNLLLSLYKRMLRESQKFTNYNFRMYALQRVRDGFKENKTESDPEKVKTLIKFADSNYEVIKRQVILSQLYEDTSSVIEISQQTRSQ